MHDGTPLNSQDKEDLSVAGLPPSEVEAQLQKILQSPVFRSAPRHSRFLAFVVRKALAGHADSVKEYSIGLDVFDRKSDFDPGSDPVVRSEARRLRSRLADYYQTLGRLDPVHIDLPKGTYVPVFHRNGIAPPSVEPTANASENVIIIQRDGLAAAPTRVYGRRKLGWVITLGLVSSLAAGYGVHLWRARRTQSAQPAVVAAPAKARRSVAVIGFANLSQLPDSAWLSRGLSVYLTTELSAGGKLMIIPDEAVARAKAELKIGDSDGFSPQTLARIRNNLGADFVVSGAYTVLPSAGSVSGRATKLGNQIRVDLRLQNAMSGEMLPSVSETGNAAGLFDLVARVGAEVRHDLGLESATTTELAQQQSSISSDPTALRLYAEGVEKLRSFDALGARDLLEQAVKADPQFALAHSALAEAWLTLGYDAQAEQEAERAYRLSGKLALEQRLAIEGRYLESANKWNDAIATYRTLLDHYPDNIEYGLRLAQTQNKGVQFRQALATVRELKKLSDDPRIDLEEARAFNSLLEVEQARAAALLASQKAASRGQRLLVAEADLFLQGIVGHAIWGSDEQQDRVVGLERLGRDCEDMGDLNCSAEALFQIAVIKEDDPASLHTLEKALAMYTRIGNAAGVGKVQRYIGNHYWKAGDLEAAQRQYDRSTVTCKAIDDRGCLLALAIDEGNISYLQGDMRAAERAYRSASILAQQQSDVGRTVWALGSLASVLGFEGDLNGALKIFRDDADRTRGQVLTAEHVDYLENVASVLCEQGRLAEARGMLKQTQSMSPIPGVEGKRETSVGARVLAVINMAENKPADAEATLRSRAEFLESQQAIYEGVDAFDLLAQALLAQNKAAEAQAAIKRGRPLLRSSPHAYFALHFALTAARVDVVAHPRNAAAVAGALRSVHQVLAQARTNGMGKLEFEARLAEGEIEMQTGAEVAGRAHLATLERDASAKGLGLIGRQASAARQVTLAQEHAQ